MTSSPVSESAIPAGWLDAGAPPLEIDFGCHRGTFLIGMADLHRGVNFLGIERQSSRVERCLGRIARLGLSNAWAVRGEGIEALRELFPDHTVSVLHVSFPDPWPKRRHAGRRLVNAAFLAEAWRVLVPGGLLRFMTDNRPYFDSVEPLVEESWERIAWDDGRETVRTTFETTFLAQGLVPCRLALRATGVSPRVRVPELRRDEGGGLHPTASAGLSREDRPQVS